MHFDFDENQIQKNVTSYQKGWESNEFKPLANKIVFSKYSIIITFKRCILLYHGILLS